MERADLDGVTLEYEVSGTGEPVVLIHGALVADTYKAWMKDPALAGFRLIRYRRRGYAGSKGDATAPIAAQAADCLALLRRLDAVPAHVVGHSSGGAIALQVALEAPEAVRSLTLLEPALLDVPSGDALMQGLAPVMEAYQSGESAAAVDAFLRGVCGDGYRESMERVAPGGMAQAETDAATFFEGEFVALGEWAFTREDAARIRQPVMAVLGAGSEALWPGWREGHERVLEWMPQAKPFVLAGAAHLLQVERPREMAAALAEFLHGVNGS